jgi:hypothetical protein
VIVAHYSQAIPANWWASVPGATFTA